jgi:hypothetical protein
MHHPHHLPARRNRAPKRKTKSKGMRSAQASQYRASYKSHNREKEREREKDDHHSKKEKESKREKEDPDNRYLGVSERLLFGAHVVLQRVQQVQNHFRSNSRGQNQKHKRFRHYIILHLPNVFLQQRNHNHGGIQGNTCPMEI